MYILAPIDLRVCPNKWVNIPAISLTNYATPSYDTESYVDGRAYAANNTVNINGYDFVSLINDNGDNPANNFIGRVPDVNDPTTGFNNNTWGRMGVTNQYKCFIPIAAGYTETKSGAAGSFRGSIYPTPQTDVAEYILMNQEKLFLLCSGIVGASLTLQALNASGNGIKGTECTVTLEDVPYADPMCLSNPELPSNAHSFVYPMTGGLTAGAQKYQFTIEAVSHLFLEGTQYVTFAENILLGRMVRIGITQWDDYTLSLNDRSLIVDDGWGIASLEKRRVSRGETFKIIITPRAGQTIDSRIAEVYRFLMYLRGTISMFLPTNIDISTVDAEITEVPYKDCKAGLLKDVRIADISSSHAVLSLNVETVPSGYRV